jgi:hypothetical protein
MSDQTSLDLLNDIVQPEAVGWFPLAPGWYVVGVLAGLGLLLFGWRLWTRWRRNRYRRLALGELAAIKGSGDPMEFARLPGLLKRAALSAWPRQQVAALSGSEWHAFLDGSASTSIFRSGAGSLLDQLSYGAGQEVELTGPELENAWSAADLWLRRHQAGSTEA